jgi:hypothetical protein
MNVKYKSVANLIDNNIKDKLKEVCLLDLISDLSERTIKFAGLIETNFPGTKAEVVLQRRDYDSIESAKLKYYVCYIHHCNKRVENLAWILKNRLRFHQFDNIKVFNLIQLKEKLSVENSLPF